MDDEEKKCCGKMMMNKKCGVVKCSSAERGNVLMTSIIQLKSLNINNQKRFDGKMNSGTEV